MVASPNKLFVTRYHDMAEQPSSFYLKATIEGFEDKNAIIRFEDGQVIRWPQKNLPDDCIQGNIIRIILKTTEDDSVEREKIAKEILNQLLKKK